MPVKCSSRSRLAFGAVAVLSVIALGGCAIPKSQATVQAETYEHIKANAEAGNATAQYFWANHLMEGENDLAGAFPWFLKSAQGGDALAQRKVAGYYYYGSGGVPEDHALAASWMRKSAEQGDERAQLSLSTMYGAGDGVPKNKAKQIEWLEKSAKQFDRTAYDQLVKLGDPHGVAKQVEAQREENTREAGERLRADQIQDAIRQQNSRPVQQQMCSINNGQVTYQVPC